jgi:DNA-binding transcriptional MerR regulator
MRIGELATRTGVSVRSIRHYEQRGLVRAGRRATGYREFDESAVELVRRIRVLLRNGFTLEEIRSVAVDLDGSNLESVCSEVVALYRRKLTDVDAQIRELQDLQLRIRVRLTEIAEQRSQAAGSRPSS